MYGTTNMDSDKTVSFSSIDTDTRTLVVTRQDWDVICMIARVGRRGIKVESGACMKVTDT